MKDAGDAIDVGASARGYPNAKMLEGFSRRYFKVPSNVIMPGGCDLPDGSGNELLMSFCFFSIRKGLDDVICFSLNDMAKWSGRKPNRNHGKINSKFKMSVDALSDMGCISVDGNVSHTSCASATFNSDKLSDDCGKYQYAVIYLDEIRKILEWDGDCSTDPYLSKEVLLLLFCYLRMMIYRRNGEIDEDAKRVDVARSKYPEVFCAHYEYIAGQIGVNGKTVARATRILADIGLIFYKPLPRYRLDGTWRTDQTAFCNAYKRDGVMLLDEGECYCDREIRAKKALLRMDV